MSLILKLNTVLILWWGILSILPESNLQLNYNEKGSDLGNYTKSSSVLKGYNAVTNYNDGFIALGTEGKIDWISLTGEVIKTEIFPGIKFNCILTTDQLVIAAGNNGKVVISNNNQPFKEIESGTDKNINSLTYFAEFIIAGCDDGEILIGDKEGFFQTIRINVKGNITSLSSREDKCFGVTDEGEVIRSEDGLNWEVFNYNESYAGYYKSCRFRKVLATGNSIAVIGVHEDLTPAVLFSNLGNVWTERTLNVADENGMDGYLEDIPNDIYYDQLSDEYYLPCTNGKILTLPNCSHCNSTITISDKNLLGIAFNQNTFLVVGEDFFIKSFKAR